MKLTKEMKRNLAKALIERKFAKQQAALEKDAQGIAERLYEQLYPESVRTAMYALPDGWLPVSTYIYARLNNGKCEDNQDEDEFESSREQVAMFNFADCKRFLATDADGRIEVKVRDPSFVEVLKTLDTEKDRVRDARTKLRNKIADQLWGYNTRAQLLEGWPAARAVIEKVIPERMTVTPNVPMLIPDELTAELELP